MVEPDVVVLFEDLRHRYPMAAAGLIEQLCFNLSLLLDADALDGTAVASACETIARCFRPMDSMQLPESYPWDAAYAIFGRWLMRGQPQYIAALKTITAWSDGQLELCKARYSDMIRANRDDWNRAAEMLDTKDLS